MTLFLDTSVLISACGSEKGASRHVCECGTSHGWRLITSGYCRNETLRNLPRLGAKGLQAWERIVEPRINPVPDVISFDKTLVFEKAKDRPVLISALAAEAEYLLTLDRTDFHATPGSQVYGMFVRTPAEFLTEQRSLGHI
jgi:predicted nucleic acid-binding protein